MLRLAAEQARKRGDREWDREHVLLALCRLSGEPKVRGAAILASLGVDEVHVRDAVDRHRPPGPELDEVPPLEHGGPPDQQVFAAHSIERVLIHCRWLAAHFGQRAADTEHVLLGVFSDEDPANKIFTDLGLRFENAYQALTGEPPPKELVPHREVIIPIGDLEIALSMLPKVLPAGVSYGFNFDEQRAWFSTSSDLDLEGYMKRALEE